jgi:FtsH-binding integral membrane protein
MTNKALAIFGIGIYIFSVLTASEDLEGNYLLPPFLIAFSAILTLVFVVITIIRLWKEAKLVSRMFLYSFVISYILAIIQFFSPFPNGSPIIIIFNITNVIYLIVYIWAVITLFRSKPNKFSKN